MFCKLKQENNIFKCEICGIESNTNAQLICRGKKIPSTFTRVFNFVKSAALHAVAGNPVVAEEIMKKRLEICQGCELFKRNQNEVGGVCTHSSCGCNIQDNLNYLNKIAWADQECPIGKWGKETPNSGV